MFEHYDVDSLTDYIDIEFEANEEVYYEELLTLNNPNKYSKTREYYILLRC